MIITDFLFYFVDLFHHIRAAAARLDGDLMLLNRQFEEGNAVLLKGWKERQRAALGLLGEVCLGVESNQVESARRLFCPPHTPSHFDRKLVM